MYSAAENPKYGVGVVFGGEGRAGGGSTVAVSEPVPGIDVLEDLADNEICVEPDLVFGPVL